MFEYNTIEDAIEDIKNGKMIIVTDDEDRENEGDLIMAAEKVTGEAMNFIATYAKGLICMPAAQDMLNKLEIGQMVENNTDNHCTAFTVSIDHVDTTTGISAFERAETVLKFTDDNAKPDDFRRPGHIFPLAAKDGGVMERNGHTEATVDLAKLAGLKPCGICCEIMKDDGTMARTPDLIEFAQKHNLKFITVKALREYILANGLYVEKVVTTTLPTDFGEFNISGFVDHRTGEHHIALTMGDVSDGNPVLTRIHSECLTGDVLGSHRCDCGNQYKAALKAISEHGRGVMLYMRQEGRGIGLINKLKAYKLQNEGMDTVEANLALGFPEDMRKYDTAAYMLQSLDVNSVELMTNNPKKIEGLEKYGITVEKRIPIEVNHSHTADFYMHTKKVKMGHLIENDN
jgi:3,4-dihydroxy 2-butanone 4-phosphate synthase/GTP cyclohydrolase II